MATLETMTTQLTALFAAWNRQPVRGAFDAFASVLADLSDEQLALGVQRAIESGAEHPPNAGALRKLCLGCDRQTLEARANEAWLIAERNASLEVNPRSLGDPLLLHAIGALGGWRTFCCEPTNEWQRRNFVAAYVAAAENPQLEEVAKLSHAGQLLGALADVRKQLGDNLKKPPADRGEAA